MPQSKEFTTFEVIVPFTVSVHESLLDSSPEHSVAALVQGTLDRSIPLINLATPLVQTAKVEGVVLLAGEKE